MLLSRGNGLVGWAVSPRWSRVGQELVVGCWLLVVGCWFVVSWPRGLRPFFFLVVVSKVLKPLFGADVCGDAKGKSKSGTRLLIEGLVYASIAYTFQQLLAQVV